MMSALSGIDIALWDLKGLYSSISALHGFANTLS
jgi:L-alanine-DL-glutamate epimerase-like enolase superfamily enzyme